MNAWEWVGIAIFGTLAVILIAWGLWLLGLDVYLYNRRERKATRADCRACQGTPAILLTGDAARSRFYLADHGRVANPIGLCDEHLRIRQRIDRLERETLDGDTWTKPRSIDKLTVVEAYPGAWSVDAEGITITADTAADAIAIVHRALLGEQATP